MKETIRYYYNIDVDNLESQDGKYFFKYQNQDFFFVFFNRNLDELDDILKCCINMKEKGVDAHNIIVNINGEVLTKVDNYNYYRFMTAEEEAIYKRIRDKYCKDKAEIAEKEALLKDNIKKIGG